MRKQINWGGLLDTCVISAFAPERMPLAPATANWFTAHDAAFFLSAVTVAEIRSGVAKPRRKGADRKADAVAGWLARLQHHYSDRILSFDVAAAVRAGDMMDAACLHGHDPDFADVAIAATAQSNGLIVLTESLRHFEPLSVAALNPFVAFVG